MKKVCLVIIDGWGHNENKNEKNAINSTECEWMRLLSRKYQSYLVYAHGKHVGLPENQMGNSEVGHLTIGCGRVVPQDQVRINKIISEERMGEYLNISGKRLHIIGLLSDGGVHGHIDHIKSVIRNLKEKFNEIFLHVISDGRDTHFKSVNNFVNEVGDFMVEMGNGKFGSISGRFYSMDRDKNWERTMESYKMMIGMGNIFDIGDELNDPTQKMRIKKVIEENYNQNITDEFIKPELLDKNSSIGVEDTILFTNYRADRMRQIVKVFLDNGHNVFTMTEYDKKFSITKNGEQTNLNIKNQKKVQCIFMRPKIELTLGEVVSKSGLTQSRIAETEKYAHVTYFLNGGTEEKFFGEKRFMVPSPKVPIYSETPEMNLIGVLENIMKQMKENIDLIVANLAPTDMVGHTGKFKETCQAVRATDETIGLIYEAAKENNYVLIITADHGNAECMEKDGKIVTKHTTNKVPLILCSQERDIHSENEWGYEDSEYSLIDVAPTVLDILGIKKPELMTGNSVLKK